MKEMLSIARTADILGVHPATIRRWDEDGKIEGVTRTIGGHRRIPVSEVEKLLGRNIDENQTGTLKSLCPNCGIEFIPKQKRHVCCSRKCGQQNRRQKELPPQFNPHFFEMATPVSAYWAGFILADGYVSPIDDGTCKLKIGLSTKDRDHLVSFREAIGAAHVNIYDNNHNGISASTLTIVHDGLREGLSKWGIVPGKTFNVILPDSQMTDGVLPHFVRGFVDGDGSIGSYARVPNGAFRPTIQISCSRQMAEWLSSISPTKASISTHHTKTLSDGSIWESCNAVWSGRHKALSVLRWLEYDNPDLPALERKRRKAIDVLQLFSSTNPDEKEIV